MRRLAVLAGVLGVLSVVGCASRPTEPSPDQPWLTLEEYKAAVASGASTFVSPVVTVPAGVQVELQVSKKPNEFAENLDFSKTLESIYFDALEPVEDQIFTIRLRTKKVLHLDLEHLLASGDKQSWVPLSFYFFPVLRESRVMVNSGGAKPDIVVPVLATADQGFLMREYPSGVKLK